MPEGARSHYLPFKALLRGQFLLEESHQKRPIREAKSERQGHSEGERSDEVGFSRYWSDRKKGTSSPLKGRRRTLNLNRGRRGWVPGPSPPNLENGELIKGPIPYRRKEVEKQTKEGQ